MFYKKSIVTSFNVIYNIHAGSCQAENTIYNRFYNNLHCACVSTHIVNKLAQTSEAIQ